jgi:hypothetical protein
MYRKISYSIMVLTLFLSWGLMLRVAYSQDATNGDAGTTPRAIANITPKAYTIPHDASKTVAPQPAVATAKGIDDELPA